MRRGTSNIEHSTLNLEVKSAARAWAQGGIGKEYRKLLLGAGQEVVVEAKVVKRGTPKAQAEAELTTLEEGTSDLVISKIIRYRIRYFSDGVVIGSKDFVDTFFKKSRKPRGALSPLKDQLYSVRDFQASTEK